MTDALANALAGLSSSDDEEEAPRSDIFCAAASGDCALLRALLAEGQDVNAREVPTHGMTPLHFAANWGRPEAVALLLEHGADMGSRTSLKFSTGDAGETPLHMAAHKCRPRCITLLLAAGADVNAKMTSDSTAPLLRVWQGYTSMEKKTACAQLLIQAGARVDVANNQGDTPIWAAVRKGHRQLAKLLLRAGAETPSDSRLFYDNSANALVKRVKARGGWNPYASNPKRVLAGLVTKCTGKPGFPDDAAGLVVEFWCPPGGF